MSDQHCYDFPRPAVTVDIAVFRSCNEVWEILLIRRKKNPFAGYYALPGGFVDQDEPLHEAAKRELQEETDLRVDQLEQLRAYGDPGRDPRGHTVSIVHCAIVDSSAQARGQDDAEEARWFGIDGLPRLAFDHDQIVKDATTWLRAREHRTQGETDW